MSNDLRDGPIAMSLRSWLDSNRSYPYTFRPAEIVKNHGIDAVLPSSYAPGRKVEIQQWPIRPVNFYSFRNVKLCSDGGSLYRFGDKFCGSNIMPSYADKTTSENRYGVLFSDQRSREIECAFILLHNTFGTYGHFLLEMAPKLLAYKALLSEIPGLPILLSWYTPYYVNEWMDIIVPGAPTVYLERDKHTFVHQALYSDMWMDGYIPGGPFREFINSSKATAPMSDRTPSEGRKLFITRKRRRNERSDFREWINEDEAKAALVSRGFRVIAPETLTIAKQIESFRDATVIVGELSSALHNAIFSKAGTLVVQINPFNSVQTQLSLSLGHSLVSIIPDSGVLQGWPPKTTRQEFTVDIPTIVEAIGDITGEARPTE